MLLTNSIKIMFSNLASMWKILLYKFLALLVFIALFAIAVLPQIKGLLDAISGTKLAENFSSVISSVLQIDLNLGAKAFAFNESLRQTLEILADNGVSFAWVYVTIFIIFCIYRFLNSLLDVPLTSVLDTNLTSCAKMPLIPTLFKNFKKSAKYSFFSLLIMLPSSVLIIIIIYFLAQVLISWFGTLALFFVLFFIIILVVLLFAFHSTVFSMWRPAAVTGNEDILPAFKTGIKISFKKFWLLYSYYVMIYLAGIFLNLIIAVFTCGAGLIISLPLSMLLSSVFQLVFYFSYNRKKYYLDGDTIIGARLDHSMPDLEPPENSDEIE